MIVEQTDPEKNTCRMVMKMRIERVDDKTVKCFLSNEELEEYDIDYKDFVLRSEKAKEVVQDIMEQAAEEVGYKPPQFAFDLQIMMLPDKGLVLTFSEKDPIDLENNQELLACLKEMKEIVQRARRGLAPDGTLPENRTEGAGSEGKDRLPGSNSQAGGKRLAGNDSQAENNRLGSGSQAEDNGQLGAGGTTSPDKASEGKEAERQGEKSGQKQSQVRRPEFAVFCFENIREVCSFASALPANLRVKSALFLMEDNYYLYMNKGAASYERYSKACIQAMEFAGLYTAEEERVLYIEEHGQCLIAERALKKLRLS